MGYPISESLQLSRTGLCQAYCHGDLLPNFRQFFGSDPRCRWLDASFGSRRHKVRDDNASLRTAVLVSRLYHDRQIRYCQILGFGNRHQNHIWITRREQGGFLDNHSRAALGRVLWKRVATPVRNDDLPRGQTGRLSFSLLHVAFPNPRKMQPHRGCWPHADRLPH